MNVNVGRLTLFCFAWLQIVQSQYKILGNEQQEKVRECNVVVTE